MSNELRYRITRSRQLINREKCLVFPRGSAQATEPVSPGRAYVVRERKPALDKTANPFSSFNPARKRQQPAQESSRTDARNIPEIRSARFFLNLSMPFMCRAPAGW